MSEKKYVIYLAFLKYDEKGSIYEKFLLYLTSCFLNGKMDGILHVEAIIPDKKKRYAYFSSSARDERGLNGVKCLSIVQKTDKDRCKYLDRPGYCNFLEIKLDKEQFNKIFKFLDEQIDKPFNDKGWTYNYIPFIRNYFGNIDMKGEQYTCSELVWTALRHIDFVGDDYNTYSISPQQIFDVLTSEQFYDKVKDVNVTEVVNQFSDIVLEKNY